jgi:hypothetical protein
MHNQEKALLKEASAQIKNLRRHNELLSARLGGFDDALLLLRTPAVFQGQGMSEDLTWKIDKHVAAMEVEEQRMPMASPDDDQEVSLVVPEGFAPRRK